MGFEMLALGSPVEFMESYEYRLLAEMIVAAKKTNATFHSITSFWCRAPTYNTICHSSRM